MEDNRAISPISGAFISPTLEARFRKSQWPAWSTEIRGPVVIAASLFLSTLGIDFLRVGVGAAFLLILFIKGTVYCTIVGTALLTYWTRTFWFIEALLFVGAIGLSSSLVFVGVITGDLLSPSALMIIELSGIIAVLIFYIFVPNRLHWTIASGLYTSAAFTWLAYAQPNGHPVDSIGIGLTFLVINILGYGTKVRLRTHRRRAFLDREELLEEISAREKINDRLRESYDDFTRLFDAAPLPLILVRSKDGTIIKLNEAALRFFGPNVANHPKIRTADFLPLHDQRKEIANTLKRSGKVENIIVQSINADSRPVWGVVSALPTKFQKQDTSIVAFADVTEQMEISEQLRKTENKLQTILDNMPDVFYRTDTRGIISMISPACIDVIGYTPEELIGTKMTDLYIDSSEQGRVVEKLLAAKGKPTQVEAFMKRKDNKVIWISTRAFLRMDENGAPIGVEGIARDLTEKKELEDTLRHALEEADTANLAKTKFLAAASHDLRQPLQALMLYSGILKKRLQKSAQEAIVDEVESSLITMSELLDALLDISKLEAGAIIPEKRIFPISQIFERMRTRFAPVAANGGLKLKIMPSEHYIESDPVLFENILGNLVGNAIRYTNKGTVLIGCRRSGTELKIQVHDTGIGIGKGESDRIFEDFYQVGNPGRDRKQGLGLGLSIVVRTAKLLGHKLDWHSQEERGSVFSVTVPRTVKPLSLPPSPSPKTRSTAKAKILLVDDDEDVLRALSAFLNANDNETIEAASLEEAVKKINCESKKPGIVVADYRLAHGTNGTEVISAVRSKLGEDIPAILITGDTDPDRISQIKATGLPLAHKPINHGALLALIAAALEAN